MRLLALDGNSIINRAYYGIRLLSNKEGIYTNAILGFLNILMKIEEEVQPDAVAVAFDMKGPTFRHEMFDDYKAGRKGMPDELAMQMPILQELLADLGYTIVKKEGYEADDILGTLGAACKKNGDECVIATGDRDSFQLVGDGVTVRLAFTKGGQPQAELIDEEYIKAKYGVTPKQMIDVKALMGDPSDNIPGVKGIGEKTALGLIQQYGTLDYIYENFEDIELKPAQRRNLAAEKDIAYMSRELAEIDCDVPVETSFEHYHKMEVDNTKAYPLMAKLELFSQMERLGVYPPTEGETDDEQKPKNDELNIKFGRITPEIYSGFEHIDVLFQLENGEITGIALVNGDTIYYQDRETKESAKEILTSNIPKRTNKLKELWHYAISSGIEINNVIFDVEIGGYILNPNASDYSVERLMGEYGIFVPTLEENQREKFPILEQSIGLSKLCDALYKEIKENKQEYLLCDIEIPLAEVLASMEHVGIAIDAPGIEKFGDKLDKTISETEKRIFEHVGKEFNVNSPKQLSEILFEDLKLPPGKKTKTGYSTNIDVLEGLKGKHPIIEDILEYRQNAKLKSTYVDGLLAVVGEDGRIHSTFQQTLTRTGRISSTEPNLQNIPIRTELGSEMRRFFVAGEGYKFLDADYSQIELRVLAHLSQDSNMIDAFKHSEDIHAKTAAQVFNMPMEMVTPLMRSRAKAVNFGIVYGIGAFSLSQDINVTVGEADDYIKGYLSYYSGVQNYMESVIEEGKEQGYVSTMFNRRRYLPELSSKNYNMREFGKRVARNMPIQGSAADIIKIAMVRVYNRLKEEGMKSRLILQIHDELMVEAVPEEIEKASQILKEEMENAAKLNVPLVAEVESGANWLEV